MITYAKLIQALNGILSQKYPQINRYGNDTTEGWRKPYFFVECVPRECKYQTQNYIQKACSMKITYFQETTSEIEQLEKVEEIQELLGMKFCVGERKLDVKNYIYEYVGEFDDILQITFELDWLERRPRECENDTMETVNFNLEKGEKKERTIN